MRWKIGDHNTNLTIGIEIPLNKYKPVSSIWELFKNVKDIYFNLKIINLNKWII